jgi:hypothetical protein
LIIGFDQTKSYMVRRVSSTGCIEGQLRSAIRDQFYRRLEIDQLEEAPPPSTVRINPFSPNASHINKINRMIAKK